MRTFNIIKNIILFELIGLFAIFLVLYYYRITQPIDSGINYNNNTLSVINPERGFYYPLSHNFDTTSSDPLWTVSQLEKYSEEVSIFHLRFGLECYSTKAGGEDANISAATLQALSLTFENIRQVNATAIIRFSYDRNGSITESGNLDFEPSLDLIETHISQLGTIISQNLDVVSYIESGMFGPWGEQNKTVLSKGGAENYYRLVEAWLNIIPSTRSIAVRRPIYFMYWANLKHNLSLTPENIKNFQPADYKDCERVGVFNDGYLGNATDLGTFENRESEISWLNKQATTTFYGGEVVKDRTGTDGEAVGEYNNINYIEKEGFLTHTTYLNSRWNPDVINEWRNQLYRKKLRLFQQHLCLHLCFKPFGLPIFADRLQTLASN